MTITIRDTQSADMAGWAAAQDIYEEWEREYMTPAVVDYFRAMMGQLSPEQHRQLHDMDPDSYNRVMNFITQGGQGNA